MSQYEIWLSNHWSQEHLDGILKKQFSIIFYWLVSSDLLMIMPPDESHGTYWWWVNIGSGNGSVPSGNKPLPDPMLIQIFNTIWHHEATISLWWNNISFTLSCEGQGDSAMIFTCDFVTRENHCWIASLVRNIGIHGNLYIILHLRLSCTKPSI